MLYFSPLAVHFRTRCRRWLCFWESNENGESRKCPASLFSHINIKIAQTIQQSDEGAIKELQSFHPFHLTTQ